MKKFCTLLLILWTSIALYAGNAFLDFGVSTNLCDKIVQRPGYTLGYSNDKKQALWVIYELTEAEVRNVVAKRTNKFKPDPAVDESATLEDYRRSGYDRGHLAPAADMRWSRQAMADSFYLSNMSPQVPSFNRGIWGQLEEKVREYACTENAIVVVTGPVFTGDCTTIGPNRVPVPTAFYKVIYDTTPPTKMIAFLPPNEGSRESLAQYVVTVDMVEELTGIDFFTNLDADEQFVLESQSDKAGPVCSCR